MSFIIFSVYSVSTGFSTVYLNLPGFYWGELTCIILIYNEQQAFKFLSSKEKDFKKQETQIVTQHVANLCKPNFFSCKTTKLSQGISICNGLSITPLTELHHQLSVRFSAFSIWSNQVIQEMAFPWKWKHTACTTNKLTTLPLKKERCYILIIAWWLQTSSGQREILTVLLFGMTLKCYPFGFESVSRFMWGDQNVFWTH